jgi:OOP family OmpA-OmpF porin
MRKFLLVTASLVSFSLAPTAFAASADDAAYNKDDKPVVDSLGHCVRTKWMGAEDPCAPAPTPKPVAVAKPAPAPAPAPVPVLANITREQLTIYFDFNSAKLTTESVAKLNVITDIINKASQITEVKIHGFTDQLGTTSYNDALANKRAAAVKSYIDSRARLKSNDADIRGLGKSSPEASCASVKKRAAKIACMKTERRVEVEFVAQD